MKLQRELPENLNLVNAYDAAAITVNRVAYPCNLVVAPQALRENWLEGGFEDLTAEHLAALLALKPALVLLGTGARQQFPKPAVLRPLIEAGVGWEVMDTGSACRTYNVLASEGREVVAALLLPTNT